MLPEKSHKSPVESKPMERPENGTIVSMEHYEGAIPHPKLMKEWEELVPGSAKSIFRHFEQQSEHRIESEKKVVRANNFKLYVGPIFAFIIAMTAVGGGIYISVTQQVVVGGLLSFSGLATIIAPFLVNELRQSRQDKESE